MVAGVSSLNVIQPSNISVKNSINPNFKANELDNGLKGVREFPDRTEYKYETEGSTGKKWGVGIASAFCPGLGQAINGQWGRGIAFFGATALASMLAVALAFKGKIGATCLASLGITGLEIASIVDAVRNAKSEETVIVPKQVQMNALQTPQTPTVNYQA